VVGSRARVQRLHLFEWGDQPWLPQSWREAMTGYLTLFGRVSGVYARVELLLRGALSVAPEPRFIDLCSGAGGPWPELAPAFDEATVVLTDLYAVPVAAPGLERFPDPVDARHVPPQLRGVRTIFNGFHHFRPHEAREVLRDAWEQRQPICIVELSERRIINVLSGPVIVLMFMIAIWFIRPFRPSWIVWCWLVPVLPWLVAWDGVVSHLRVYTPDEMRAMVADLQSDGYHWDIGQLKHGPARVTYLRGLPGASALAITQP
jgi:hypothetical protein